MNIISVIPLVKCIGKKITRRNNIGTNRITIHTTRRKIIEIFIIIPIEKKLLHSTYGQVILIQGW